MKQDDGGSAPTLGSQRDTFEAAVMNWISEATSLIQWRSDGGRKIMADACGRCWGAAKPDGDITYPVALTDDELAAVKHFAKEFKGKNAAILRGLLERLG